MILQHAGGTFERGWYVLMQEEARKIEKGEKSTWKKGALVRAFVGGQRLAISSGRNNGGKPAHRGGVDRTQGKVEENGGCRYFENVGNRCGIGGRELSGGVGGYDNDVLRSLEGGDFWGNAAKYASNCQLLDWTKEKADEVVGALKVLATIQGLVGTSNRKRAAMSNFFKPPSPTGEAVTSPVLIATRGQTSGGLPGGPDVGTKDSTNSSGCGWTSSN